MSNKPKWTPGPWSVTVWPHVDASNGVTVADVNGAETNLSAQADARLIAAAPLMVEALKRAAPWLGKLIADGGHINSILPKDAVVTLDMVEDAIRAAKGDT